MKCWSLSNETRKNVCRCVHRNRANVSINVRFRNEFVECHNNINPRSSNRSASSSYHSRSSISFIWFVLACSPVSIHMRLAIEHVFRVYRLNLFKWKLPSVRCMRFSQSKVWPEQYFAHSSHTHIHTHTKRFAQRSTKGRHPLYSHNLHKRIHSQTCYSPPATCRSRSRRRRVCFPCR